MKTMMNNETHACCEQASTIKLAIITRSNDWTSTAIMVESSAALMMVEALNKQGTQGDDWQVTSVPLTTQEAESTLLSWKEDGL
jgi:hypothetical protein